MSAPSLALPARAPRVDWGVASVALLIALFLLFFLVVPAVMVIYVAFTEKGTGVFTLVNFADFFATDLLVRSFWNSIWVAGMTVLLASVFALPLAAITTFSQALQRMLRNPEGAGRAEIEEVLEQIAAQALRGTTSPFTATAIPLRSGSTPATAISSASVVPVGASRGSPLSTIIMSCAPPCAGITRIRS